MAPLALALSTYASPMKLTLVKNTEPEGLDEKYMVFVDPDFPELIREYGHEGYNVKLFPCSYKVGEPVPTPGGFTRLLPVAGTACMELDSRKSAALIYAADLDGDGDFGLIYANETACTDGHGKT